MLHYQYGGLIQAFPLHKDTVQATFTNHSIADSDLNVLRMQSAGTVTLNFEGGGSKTINALAGSDFSLGKEVISVTTSVEAMLS